MVNLLNAKETNKYASSAPNISNKLEKKSIRELRIDTIQWAEKMLNKYHDFVMKLIDIKTCCANIDFKEQDERRINPIGPSFENALENEILYVKDSLGYFIPIGTKSAIASCPQAEEIISLYNKNIGG